MLVMDKVTYFAVFEPTSSGYSAYFPDLPGCITVGKDIEETIRMAKEALGLHLWGLEKDEEQIPKTSLPPFSDISSNSFVMPIEVFPKIFKNEIENKAIKKTLTIPYWLNDLAEKDNVNFSQILQNALKEYLHLL